MLVRWLLYHCLFGLSSANALLTKGQDFLMRNMIWMGARAHRPDRSCRRERGAGVSHKGNSWECRVNQRAIATRRSHLDTVDIYKTFQRANRSCAAFLQ